jgi:hypothetical protein
MAVLYNLLKYWNILAFIVVFFRACHAGSIGRTRGGQATVFCSPAAGNSREIFSRHSLASSSP